LRARFASAIQSKSILYIDDRVPHPSLGAGFPRANYILRELVRQKYRVTLVPLNFPLEDTFESAAVDVDPSVEIMIGTGRHNFREFLEERLDHTDLIWVSRPHNFAFVIEQLSSLRLSKPSKNEPRLVYDAEALYSLREIQELELAGTRISREDKRARVKAEIDLASAAEVVISVSEKDRRHFAEAGLQNIEVIGHALDYAATSNPDISARGGLLFVGNLDYDNSPNVDSLEWFVHEIFPILRKIIPEITLTVVGSDRSKKVRALSSDAIRLLGRVHDVADFYRSARVFIAPTRFAAGIPYKIHEAAANGLPVVGTDILEAQLDWRGTSAMLSSPVNDAAKFAENVAKLYRNEELWRATRDAAQSRVMDDCDPERARERIRRCVDG